VATSFAELERKRWVGEEWECFWGRFRL